MKTLVSMVLILIVILLLTDRVIKTKNGMLQLQSSMSHMNQVTVYL